MTAVGSRSTLVCNALHRYYRYYPYYTYYEYYTDVRATSREQRPGEERLLLFLSPSPLLRPLTLLVPSIPLHPSHMCLPFSLFISFLFSSSTTSSRVEYMQLLCASTHGSSFASVFSGSSSFLAFSPLCTSTPLFPLPILLLLVVLPCGPTSGRFNVRDFLTPLILLRPSVLHFLVRLLHLHPLPRPAACPLLAHPPRPVPRSL